MAALNMRYFIVEDNFCSLKSLNLEGLDEIKNKLTELEEFKTLKKHVDKTVIAGVASLVTIRETRIEAPKSKEFRDTETIYTKKIRQKEKEIEMSDWGPVLIAVVLFVLLSPGLLFQLPGRHKIVEFGNMQTSGLSVLVHTVLYFALITIFLIAIGVHIHTG
ncbi:uncharacterized protein LOC107020940 [Solanum pennellii]|uniref:Uncharacterized protein LOC107020940 n=1 Tax=Solanum pennellii TaxID=28526 RepID=A0ABM1GWH2_SOLPN|nr:uncharacterized protein LOC107020940 [Solanum pennellii]